MYLNLLVHKHLEPSFYSVIEMQRVLKYQLAKEDEPMSTIVV